MNIPVFTTKYLGINKNFIPYLFYSFSLSDFEYGGWLIFKLKTPLYYFNFIDKECGDTLKEINEFIKINELNYGRFLCEILKYDRNQLSTYPHEKFTDRKVFLLRKKDKSLVFDLHLYNIDFVWNNLSEKQKNVIQGKSKQKKWDL